MVWEQYWAQQLACLASDLRMARAHRQESQRHVYEQTGVPISTISRLERGEMSGVTLETTVKLLRYYNLEVSLNLER